MIYYVPTWIIFGFWLFMVTYLQHHAIEGSIIYDDSNFNFVIAGLETIDRKYGYGIDDFHHIFQIVMLFIIYFFQRYHIII